MTIFEWHHKISVKEQAENVENLVLSESQGEVINDRV